MDELSEDRIAHLGMIQDLITRMAGESARMKQFALAALGALAATSEATDSAALAYVAGVLAIVFWLLDARYLAQERGYRRLYDEVRGADGPTDFRMTPGEDIPSRDTIEDRVRLVHRATLWRASRNRSAVRVHRR